MKNGIFSGLFNTLVLMTKKKSVNLFLFLGLTIVIVAIGLGFYTPTKFLAVIVSSVGCCIGTGVIALALPKQAGLLLEEEREKIEEEGKKKAELEQQIKKYKDSEGDRLKIQAEIERLKNMRVNVNTYRPVLKLGFTELDIDTYDFKKETLEVIDRSDKWDPRRSEKKEYVGVIRHKFRALFGVDLNKLRFKELESGELEISGLQSEFQGMNPDPVNQPWALTEVRLRLIKEQGDWKDDEYKVVSGNDLKGTNEYVEHAQKQEGAFIDRFKHGIEFKGLHDHIVKMAKEFLRITFSPLEQPITFSDSINESGRGFIEYLEVRNCKVDDQLRILESTQRSLSL